MTDHDRPGKLISTTALPALREVLLADDTWEQIKRKHPELGLIPSFYDAVINTVQNPTAVYLSATRPEDSVVFLDSQTTSLGGSPLRIPVKISAANTAAGFVSTAHFSDTTSQGTLIWERTDD